MIGFDCAVERGELTDTFHALSSQWFCPSWRLWISVERIVFLFFTAVRRVLHKRSAALTRISLMKPKRISHLHFMNVWDVNILPCLSAFLTITRGANRRGRGERLFCLSEGAGVMSLTEGRGAAGGENRTNTQCESKKITVVVEAEMTQMHSRCDLTTSAQSVFVWFVVAAFYTLAEIVKRLTEKKRICWETLWSWTPLTKPLPQWHHWLYFLLNCDCLSSKCLSYPPIFMI